MLGETAPCSQRAIRERALPLRSDSSSWVSPARVRASRIEIGSAHDLSLRHGQVREREQDADR